MITRRMPPDDFGNTTISIYPDAQHEQARSAHTVACRDFDYEKRTDQRVPPTARVYLLGTHPGIAFEDVRRLAAEYAYVADIAEALQAELRAAYAADHPADRGGE